MVATRRWLSVGLSLLLVAVAAGDSLGGWPRSRTVIRSRTVGVPAHVRPVPVVRTYPAYVVAPRVYSVGYPVYPSYPISPTWGWVGPAPVYSRPIGVVPGFGWGAFGVGGFPPLGAYGAGGGFYRSGVSIGIGF